MIALAMLGTLALAAMLLPSSAAASHFRYGNLSWAEKASRNADFSYVAAFRRSAYSGTASDGMPKVGDIITEDVGGTDLDFGDGHSTGTLRYLVTGINVSEDWLQGVALEPGSDTDTLVSHDYSGFTGSNPNDFTGSSGSCCTIFNLNNNASDNYGLQTQLRFGMDNESPVSGLPTIVGVGSSGVQTFTVPASDPDVPGTNHFRFRLPGSAECGGCSSAAPSGLAINPATGQVTWNTTGVAEGLWYHSYVIEERNPADELVSSTMVAGLIRVSSTASNAAPAWETPPTPPDGTVFTVAPGNPVTFNLRATDADAGDVVTISGSGIPAGATFNASDGNPATASFSWTPSPGDERDYVVNFTPTDDRGLSGPFRSYRIRVVSPEGPAGDPTCEDGIDNDGDGLTDADDPNCQGGDEGGGGDPGRGRCFGEAATVSGLVGTSGDDVIIGTNGPDEIIGKGGDDLICARKGDDLVRAGAGSDRVAGGDGLDTIRGERDKDRLNGGAGDDRVTGGAGDDDVLGVAGDDILGGGNGNDWLNGGPGSDRCNGGPGTDAATPSCESTTSVP